MGVVSLQTLDQLILHLDLVLHHLIAATDLFELVSLLKYRVLQCIDLRLVVLAVVLVSEPGRCPVQATRSADGEAAQIESR